MGKPLTTMTVTVSGNPRWWLVVANVVEELNQILAPLPKAPRYVVVTGEGPPCTDPVECIPRGITRVCSKPDIGPPPAHWAYTWRSKKGRRAEIVIKDTEEVWGAARAVVCHEFVHAVAVPADGPKDQDSCMRGTLDHFGSWDIAQFKALFA